MSLSVLDNIKNRLANDATLVGSFSGGQYSGILKGGLWDRKLKAEGPSETIGAFYQNINGRGIRPSAVLIDGGHSPHFQVNAIPHAYFTYPKIYLYAQAGRSGKVAIDNAASRIYDLLNGWYFTTDEGSVAFVRFADSTPLLDSEEYIGAKSMYCRYEVVTRYRTGE